MYFRCRDGKRFENLLVCIVFMRMRTKPHLHPVTSVDAGASLGASLRELASEAAAVCVHS